jgi:hypothetical protein
LFKARLETDDGEEDAQQFEFDVLLEGVPMSWLLDLLPLPLFTFKIGFEVLEGVDEEDMFVRGSET